MYLYFWTKGGGNHWVLPNVFPKTLSSSAYHISVTIRGSSCENHDLSSAWITFCVLKMSSQNSLGSTIEKYVVLVSGIGREPFGLNREASVIFKLLQFPILPLLLLVKQDATCRLNEMRSYWISSQIHQYCLLRFIYPTKVDDTDLLCFVVCLISNYV